jgi:hypothetical protein
MAVDVNLQFDKVTSECFLNRCYPEELLELEAPASPWCTEVDEHAPVRRLCISECGGQECVAILLRKAMGFDKCRSSFEQFPRGTLVKELASRVMDTEPRLALVALHSQFVGQALRIISERDNFKLIAESAPELFLGGLPCAPIFVR